MKYSYIGGFINGIAIVRNNNRYGFLYGFVNENVVEICECKYTSVCSFCYGYAKVCKHNKWGFINEKGEQICDCEYSWVDYFIDGFALIIYHNNYGFLDTNGIEVITCCYTHEKATLLLEKYKLNLLRIQKIKIII